MCTIVVEDDVRSGTAVSSVEEEDATTHREALGGSCSCLGPPVTCRASTYWTKRRDLRPDVGLSVNSKVALTTDHAIEDLSITTTVEVIVADRL
jgi:hypothetical protein